MTNYRFTKGNEANKIVLKQQKLVVTAQNLTDDLAQIILGIPGFSHNVEPIPGREAMIIEKKTADKTGEIPLPESILLALKDAKIDEEALNALPKKKELTSDTLTPLTEGKQKRKRIKR